MQQQGDPDLNGVLAIFVVLLYGVWIILSCRKPKD